MSTYPSEALVRVRPFARRQEQESVTIGDLTRQVFLSIPPEGLVILDSLAEGQTVGEAGHRYQAIYGEAPDIEDFLEALEAAGFVEPADAASPSDDRASSLSQPAAAAAHLRWITPSRARKACRPLVLVVCAAVVTVAAVLVAIDPSTIPGPTVLVFRQNLALISLGLFAFGLAGVAVHELAHLVVARAAGVPARIGVSHRLWIVVAETDMTGIWMASKRARYAAFLAGPLVDAVSAAAFIGILWSQRHGWFGLTPLEVQLAGACLMVYLLRLVWQCFVFIRTDFYYVVATAFNCKNLLVDTQDFLNGCMAKVVPSRRPVDQSSIPAAEMRVVRWYSLFWLAGRAVALSTLFLVTLPILGRYAVAIAPMIVGHRSRYSLLDVLVFGLITVGVEIAGLVLWARALVRRWSERRSDALATR